MKNCEYYQKKLSDSHDDGAENTLSDELNTHLGSCDECAKFYELLTSQSSQLQNLPNINLHDKPKSIIHKIWNTNLSIPLPAAAALFLFLSGMYWYGNNIQEQPQTIEIEQKQMTYQEVQFVKFSPQSAVLVESNDN